MVTIGLMHYSNYFKDDMLVWENIAEPLSDIFLSIKEDGRFTLHSCYRLPTTKSLFVVFKGEGNVLCFILSYTDEQFRIHISDNKMTHLPESLEKLKSNSKEYLAFFLSDVLKTIPSK